jgi:hypothetical protein
MIDAPPITAKEFFETMVEVPVDDTCRTCRFWDNSYPTNIRGQCFGGTGVICTGEGHVYYPYDYGCRLHRPKEAG